MMPQSGDNASAVCRPLAYSHIYTLSVRPSVSCRARITSAADKSDKVDISNFYDAYGAISTTPIVL